MMTTKELALATADAMTRKNWTQGVMYCDAKGDGCGREEAVRACALGRAWIVGGKKAVNLLSRKFSDTYGRTITGVNDEYGLAAVKKALRMLAKRL
jgi:hypothetical protein